MTAGRSHGSGAPRRPRTPTGSSSDDRKTGIAGVRRRPGVSGGRRGPVEGGSRAALPRARAAQHPRRPDEQAQERGRQGVAQTRTQLTKISTVDGAANWLAELNAWHGEHGDYLKERTTAKQDPAHARGRKWWWTHERLRRAYFRLVRLNRAGMLFAFCDPPSRGTENRCRRPRTSWRAGPTRLSSARSTTTGDCRKSI